MRPECHSGIIDEHAGDADRAVDVARVNWDKRVAPATVRAYPQEGARHHDEQVSSGG